MQLPGRLKESTLGDILGNLHRAKATGSLELIDSLGQVHSVVLREGRIEKVDSQLGPRLGEILGEVAQFDADATSPEMRLGESLLKRGLLSAEQLGCALHQQYLMRLERLYTLPDAAIRFRVPRPQERDATAPSPLEKGEFLNGRPRKRRGARKEAARQSTGGDSQ